MECAVYHVCLYLQEKAHNQISITVNSIIFVVLIFFCKFREWLNNPKILVHNLVKSHLIIHCML